jgi:hypothetical protein|tara:strand:+ start:208 stop:591 length:384 start_codon:yes stop_codon:yes gene_type:complete
MSILNSLIGPVTGLLDKFIEDKDKKNAIAFELATMAEKHAQELAKGQIEVNKTEAAHKSLFVAGWRPCIGWICGLALLYSTLIAPILNIWFTVPPVNNDLLSTILLGMLGLAGARTVEKAFNVQRER